MVLGVFWNDVATDRYYPLTTGESITARGTGGAGFNLDRVVAYPFVTGKQNLTISEEGIWVYSVATTTTGQHRIAFYDCTSATNPYPNNLVSGSDSGTITASATGLNLATGLNFTLSANTMYWACCKRERAASGGTYGFYTPQETLFFPKNTYQESGIAAGVVQLEAVTNPLAKSAVGTGAYPSTFYSGAVVSAITSFPLIVIKVSAVS